MAIVCVVVPVYNVKEYLRRCLDSILNQSFSNFEVLLVDDGSSDGSEKICDEYACREPRFKVIHQSNQGVSSARNAGLDWAINHSTCRWIAFVDSDDWVHPDYLRFLFEATEKSGAQISMCAYIETEKSVQEYKKEKMALSLITPTEAYTCFGQKISAYPWGRLYHRDCFSKVRYPVGRIYEDIAVTYRLLFMFPQVAMVHNVLYFYYFNKNSIVHRKWDLTKLDALTAFEEQLVFFKQEDRADLEAIVAKGYLDSLSWNYRHLMNSDYQESVKEHYKKLLKEKMRCAVREYREILNISFIKDTVYYEVLFPQLVNLYWVLKEKLRRALKLNPFRQG